jgi:predicted DNA-binding transcriptional regulator AlpA
MRQPKLPIAFEHLPDSAYIRLRQLVGSVLPFSSATLWRKCRRGEFPPPVRLSAGVTAWRVGQIRLWLEDPIGFKAQQHAPKVGRGMP